MCFSSSCHRTPTWLASPSSPSLLQSRESVTCHLDTIFSPGTLIYRLSPLSPLPSISLSTDPFPSAFSFSSLRLKMKENHSLIPTAIPLLPSEPSSLKEVPLPPLPPFLPAPVLLSAASQCLPCCKIRGHFLPLTPAASLPRSLNLLASLCSLCLSVRFSWMASPSPR